MSSSRVWTSWALGCLWSGALVPGRLCAESSADREGRVLVRQYSHARICLTHVGWVDILLLYVFDLPYQKQE